MPQWSCAYCEENQARVVDAHIWMACYLGLGWSLLVVRIVLSRYILWARNNFLRRHCGAGGPDGLKGAVRKHVDAKEPGIKESSFQQAVRSTTHARTGVHTIPKKSTDGGEGGGHGGEGAGHGAAPLTRGKSAQHLQEALNRGEATKLSKDVFPCGGTKVFRQVSSCVRVIEGYYFSMIVLNGWGMASLVFGPWEGLVPAVLMMLPLVLAVLVSTSTLDEYAFLLAVCQPNMEVLVKVEHASISMMHAYVELREQFARMFAVVNPGLASTGLSAVCARAFSDADADGSGQISHREFRLMVQRLTGSTMSLTNLNRVIRVIDTDQSGSISLKEFMLFVGVNEVADASPYVRAVQAINMANRLQSAGNNDASSAQDPDASEACARAVSDASTVPQAGAPASTGGAPSAAVVPSLGLGSQEEPGGGGHMIKPRNTVGNQQRNTTKQRNTKLDDDPMAC